MYTDFSKQEQKIVEDFQEFAKEFIAPYAKDIDENGKFPKEVINSFRKHGWLGLSVSKEFGGKGASIILSSAIVCEIAKVSPSVALIFNMHLSGVSGYLLEKEKFANLLKDVANGKHLSSVAFSEEGSRGHIWHPVSKVKEEGDFVMLNAKKSFVTSANFLDGFVASSKSVNSSDDKLDTITYLVLKSDNGVSVHGSWKSLGMRGNDSTKITLLNCKIPKTREICKGTQKISLWVQTGFAVVSLGICKTIVEITKNHIQNSYNEATKSGLFDSEVARSRLGKMQLLCETYDGFLTNSLKKIEKNGVSEILLSFKVKTAGAEISKEIANLAMQVCGGVGYSKSLPLERFFRDAYSASIMGPTSDAVYDFIAKNMCEKPMF
ncbi:MAG: acyl-CoA dehydrogenase family protein [Campylobacteraceae bacterium]